MVDTNGVVRHEGWARRWPWLILALLILPAIWHVVDFPDDLDPEFPKVARPTFSKLPPPAYRLAEPGDTLDRIAIYLSAGIVVFSLVGIAIDRRGLWPASFSLGLLALGHASTPGPTFDGWHGFGPRVILDPSAPVLVRAVVAALTLGLSVAAILVVVARRRDLPSLVARGRDLGILGLLLASAVLIALRQFDFPGVEPVGYWPRWFHDFGLAAWNLALFQILATKGLPSRRVLTGLRVGGAFAWVLLVVLGVRMSWYHRPLARMRTVEPGKIYISAMPTYEGLKVAYDRHRFKTIINVFAEDTHQRSPILPDELRFVKEHGIRYLNAPPQQSKGDAFLDETLRLAQDPDAWPILLHCHGCMDRSPAWMGIYRFVVQGKPLDEIMREIEGHRGYRPKASVTLLYNRVLSRLAPDRYTADPTGRVLLESAKGTVDPYYETVRREREAESRTR